jgi:acetyl-CoA acetyltransferase
MASKEAYITGVGQSEVGVRLTRHPLLLTIDAVKEALADAGLTVDQIDGVCTYPGKMSGQPGFSPVGSEELADALGIKSKWHMGGGELPAQLAAVGNAAMAVKQGLARHIICFRTVYEAAAQARPDEYPPSRGGDVPGSMQYLMPYWAMSAANWVAQYANRHVYKYGMKREQLGQIAINAHRNAQLNPRARAISKKELTLDEYMEARMITTPLCSMTATATRIARRSLSSRRRMRWTRLSRSLCASPPCPARSTASRGTSRSGAPATMPGATCGTTPTTR